MMPLTHVCTALVMTGAIMGPNPVGLIGAVAGAVLPDLDELQSPIGWRLCQWFSHPRLGLGRQRTHSVFWSVIGLVLGWVIGLPWDMLIGGWIGWASHVILDACSGGVPLWWPWYQGFEYRVRLASWRVAGVADYMLFCLALSSLLMMAWGDRWIPIWVEMLNQLRHEGIRL